MKNAWRVWCKTIGYKISDCNIESDYAAIIRTVWILLNVITCICIIANCIHHW